MTPPTDIHDLVEALCERLGIKSQYVARLDIGPEAVWAEIYKGRDGRCEGPKYAIDANGDPSSESGLPSVAAAMETVAFEVRA